MTASVRRASGFALVGLLALVTPRLGVAAGVPFAVIALLAIVVTEGPVFELFARPNDYQVGRLQGLFGFALSAAILGTLAGLENLPMSVFTATILIVSLGNLGAVLTRSLSARPPILGHLTGALCGGFLGQFGASLLFADTMRPLPEVLTLVLAGALLATLIYSMLFSRDEPPVVFSVGFLLWLLAAIDLGADIVAITTAVVVTFTLGILAYAVDAASIEGMIAGILLGLLAIVLGGYNWLAILFAFFAIGGASSKFRYEQKLEHGVAEENGGARGGTNVLANSSVGIGALLLYRLTHDGILAGDPLLYFFAFAGAIATALSDTLASEIGGSYGRTRLITTFKPVPPGTDGGVTLQGLLAGIIGAGIIALIAHQTFGIIEVFGAGIIVVAGVAGMTIDSLLGATIEGSVLGNGSVNFTATLSGAIVAVFLAVIGGVTTLPPLTIIF